MRRTLLIGAALLAFGVGGCQDASAGSMVASYYWQGRHTASGERFNPNGYTAAHRTLRFGTRLRVTYRGRSVIVRINDRGPFIRGRHLDLSRGAARAIGLNKVGVARVSVQILNQSAMTDNRRFR